MGRFYKVDIRGKNWLQRVNGVAAWTPADEGRMLYDRNDEQVKFGNASDWGFAGAYNDVPLNTILLIESDVQLTGYTLLENKDDMLVYITKGSQAPGNPFVDPEGEAGGSDKGAGTWTQPNHDHTTQAHDHNVGAHTHSIPSGTVPGAGAHTHPPQAGFANFMSSSGSTHGEAGDSYGVFGNTGASAAGSTSHNHGGTSGSGSTSPTNSGGGLDTGTIKGGPSTIWRPRGRNFTRQQRT